MPLHARVLVLLLAAAPGSALLQAQTVCPCIEERDFGSCVLAPPVNYPGSFPGSAAALSDTISQTSLVYLYVVDLFEGFTYRYDLRGAGGVLSSSAVPQVLSSPAGSQTTTGLVYNRLDQLLYWAIDGQLISTNHDLGNAQELGTVALVDLRARLGLRYPATLGGITFHEARQTFWGVDIANDVYFEFDAEGKLALDDDGTPVHFLSPALSPYGGGAYGNGITYVLLGGTSYFDLPVGRLEEGGVTRVIRVHASAGGEGEQAHEIGDPSGLFYEIRPAAGSLDFISGIAYWPSTCGTRGHTEVVLSIAPPETGRPSRVAQISVDDPQTGTLTRFEAETRGNTVDLSWAAPHTYTRLEILRRLLPSGTLAPVATFQNHAADPRELQDRNLGDGQYEYIARVTPPGTRKMPDVKLTVVVGLGRVTAHRTFLDPELAADADPVAVTFIGSRNRVLVADRSTGRAHLYTPALEPAGVLSGPFMEDAEEGGRTTGVTWDSEPAPDGSLLWLLEASGGSFIQRTAVDGTAPGERRLVDAPFNLRRAPRLGDLSYDPFRKDLWSADQVNAVSYTFNASGALTGSSSTIQIPSPRSPDGALGGAIAVVESDATKVVLDTVAGKISAGIPTELVRVSYSRSNNGCPEGVQPPCLVLPGTEVLSLDLRSILHSTEIGGLVLAQEGEDDVTFVVGMDSQVVYKLTMESGIKGKEFRRGDVNGDNSLNISDPIALLNALFRGGPPLACEDAADVNDDTNEDVDISDAVYLFNYLFNSGEQPKPPFPGCGRDFELPRLCNEASCS